MKKIKLILAIIIILITSYLYYSSHQDILTPTQLPIVKVRTTTLVYQIQPEILFAYGNIVAPTSVQLKAQTAGIVTELHVTPGQKVQQGEIIFTLKSNDTDKQLEKLAAQMESSQQKYRRLLQVEKLLPGTIAPDLLQQQKFQYQQDLAAYEEAQQIHSVTAYVSGILSETDIAVGDFVNVGDTLATIVNSQSLQISYQVPNEYADQVHLGQVVNFISHQKRYLAKLSYIAPQLTIENEALSLRADFIEPVNLLPNTFGQIEHIINANATALAVSQDLVQTDAQGFYVYLLKNNKATKQYFSPGELTKQGMYIVESGLKAGDILITTDAKMLTANQVVSQ